MNNYQKHNIEQVKNCEENGWGFANMGRFRCMVCGEYVSPKVVDYLGRNPKVIMCYQHQKLLVK